MGFIDKMSEEQKHAIEDAYPLGLGEPEPEGIEAGQSLAAQQEAFEAHCLKAALTRHKGDIKAVLAELQLPRRTFNEKMQRHGLTREMFLSMD